jgi:predicted Zn-dependent protease with MMP-like domain/Tfp pilus assembly protein PilF
MADDESRPVKRKGKGKGPGDVAAPTVGSADSRGQADLEITDQAPPPYVDEGWHALERGDINAARTLATRALAESPSAPDALLLDAACFREEGDGEQAISVLRKVCRADPDWCTPELWLAELLAVQPETTAEALQHAAHALDLADEEDEYLNALALKAGLEAELGEIDEAKQTLRDLPPPEVALGDAMLALEIAELWLAVGEPESARDRLLTLTTAEPEMADAWYTLGVAAETLGDEAAMRSAWRKTWELDSTAGDDDEGAHLDEREVAAIAEQALAELPDKARRLLVDVPIIIADLPARADIEDGLDPRVLGLFSGTSYDEGSHLGGQPGLSQIILFRRNLERAADGEEDLREEIRTTLLHETGHFFGMDEADLESVGLD